MELQDLRQKFDEALYHYGEELKKIRAGRASPEMVENILVEAYGTKMPLKQVASISVPEPRLILIQPWDKSIIKEIERALRLSEAALNPAIDGALIRVALPPLTEERRREYIQIVKRKAEEARIQIRQVRGEAISALNSAEEEGEISEDEKFRQKDKVQEMVEEYNKKVQEMEDKKEKEIKV